MIGLNRLKADVAKLVGSRNTELPLIRKILEHQHLLFDGSEPADF